MSTKQRWSRVSAVALILFALSCVTINVYFPAADVQAAADEIVQDVYSAGDAPLSPTSWLLRGHRFSFGATAAYAQTDFNISTPKIRAIRVQLKQHGAKLVPFYDAGAIGITRKGYLGLRNTDSLSLKEKADLQKLIKADNNDRKQLYGEIVAANGLGPDDVAEVEKIFAREWRMEARSGWWYETDKGEWKQK